MNKNTIVITVISVIAIFGFLIGAYFLTNQSQTPVVNKEVNTIKADDHLEWSKEKKNILVEYSDLQCPACKSFHDYIRTELESTTSAKVNIPSKVTLVFRYFPLYQIHQNAYIGAYAAEAAGRQNKFFPMIDKLFDKQSEWQNLNDSKAKDMFVSYAKELNLDEEKFKKDMDSKEVKNRVEQDLSSGRRAGVNSTPTFFLNGVKMEIQSLQEFKDTLNNLKK